MFAFCEKHWLLFFSFYQGLQRMPRTKNNLYSDLHTWEKKQNMIDISILVCASLGRHFSDRGPIGQSASLDRTQPPSSHTT